MKSAIYLVFFILLANFAFAQEEVVMYIQIAYVDDEISVDDVGLSEGQAENHPTEDPEYTAIVSSLSGESTNVGFVFPRRVYIDSFDPDFEPDPEDLFMEDTSKLLYFPFYRDVNKLEVYDSERRLILTHDLSEYRICIFDGKCTEDENELSCPEECKEQPTTEEIAKEIKETKEKTKPTVKEKSKPYIFIFLSIIIILIIVLIRVRRKK